MTSTCTILVAGAVALGQRGVEVDAPVPDPVAWFVPVQIVSATVWCAVVLFTAQRRDLWWWKLAFVAGMSHAGVALAYAWAVRGLVVGADAPGATIAAALTRSRPSQRIDRSDPPRHRHCDQ